MLRIAEVVVTLERDLRLSQAAGEPITVTSPELHLSWDAGTVRINVRGRFAPPDQPWTSRAINARHRELSDLEVTNPGLAAALVPLVPQAPWSPQLHTLAEGDRGGAGV